MYIKIANCVNFCSDLENNNEIYSLAQYEASKFKVEESNGESDQSNVGDSRSNNNFEKDSTDKTNNNNNNPTDNYKEELLKTKEPKLEEEQENQQQENQRKNPLTVNKNSIIELQSIKPVNSPPVPPLNPNTDNHLLIKSENTSTIIVNTNTTSTTEPTTSPRDNPTKSIEVNKPIVNDDILSTSPLRRNVQLGYINISDNNVNNNNNITNKKNLLIAKSAEENRPKSVTASVFRPAAIADLAATLSQTAPLPSTTSTSSVFVCASNAPLPHMNAAPRAQSVTASVFTPISQLCNRQQQHIVKANSAITPTTVTAAILSGQQHPYAQAQPQPPPSQDMNKFMSFGDDATELTISPPPTYTVIYGNFRICAKFVD
ncbi:unnamed protein product [Ceratitis capitata]|uniref:(Mediterranean fruit fly) hypothetical protein n=1 Tax=Ceratitis capitata TaxID=7213 RepID=A0A811U1H0_CERCA|nr:unnamed protein product [Ceratitis capitata]